MGEHKSLIYDQTQLVIVNYEKNGVFSVRSAYKVANMDSEIGRASGSNGFAHWWKTLWNLNIPSKVKIFCWRACRDCLPTRDLLYRRKISLSCECPWCGQEVETVDHVLVSCRRIRNEWKGSGLLDELKRFSNISFVDRMGWFTLTQSKDTLRQCVTTEWLLWNERNKKIAGVVSKKIGTAWERAEGWLKEWDTGASGMQVMPGSTAVQTRGWEAPTEGTVKLNVDAAISAKSGRYWLGAVIRDCNGRIIASEAQVNNGYVSVVVAEAFAILAGVKMASEHGVHKLAVESDSQSVIKLCSRLSSTRNDDDNFIFDILSLVSTFSDVAFTFTARSNNEVAHSLAKWALRENYSCKWNADTPMWVVNLAQADVNCVGSPFV